MVHHPYTHHVRQRQSNSNDDEEDKENVDDKDGHRCMGQKRVTLEFNMS